jgi:hypothetical protein
MRKSTLRAALAAALLLTIGSTTANATSWRIHQNVTKKAHFTSINAAMSSDEVVAGDTLYLDPGSDISGTQTISKRVTVIGTGYRPDSPHQRARITGTVYINAANTKLEGCILKSYVHMNASNITIERCSVSGSIHWPNSGHYATIRQCCITGSIYGISSSSGSGSSYATIENNIFLCNNNGAPIRDLYSPTIRNNYIRQSSTSTSSSNGFVLSDIQYANITNNIFIQTAQKNKILYNVKFSQINNNLMSCAEGTYTGSPDNVWLDGMAESDIFTLEGIDDQCYRLKDGSPAKGAAQDGGDCGPFGGLYPYVIGGMPYGHPYYTHISVGAKPVDGKVSVSLNIEMQDE